MFLSVYFTQNKAIADVQLQDFRAPGRKISCLLYLDVDGRDTHMKVGFQHWQCAGDERSRRICGGSAFVTQNGRVPPIVKALSDVIGLRTNP